MNKLLNIRCRVGIKVSQQQISTSRLCRPLGPRSVWIDLGSDQPTKLTSYQRVGSFLTFCLDFKVGWRYFCSSEASAAEYEASLRESDLIWGLLASEVDELWERLNTHAHQYRLPGIPVSPTFAKFVPREPLFKPNPFHLSFWTPDWDGFWCQRCLCSGWGLWIRLLVDFRLFIKLTPCLLAYFIQHNSPLGSPC